MVLPPKESADCLLETASSQKPDYDAFAVKNAGLFFVQAPDSLYTFQRAGLNVVFEKNAYISSQDSTKRLETLLREEWQNSSYDFSKNPKIILERVEGSVTLYPLNPDYTEYEEIVFSDNRLENFLRLDPSAKLAATLSGETSNFEKANVRGVAYFLVSTGSEARPVRLSVFLKDLDGTLHKIAQVCIKVKSRTGEEQDASSRAQASSLSSGSSPVASPSASQSPSLDVSPTLSAGLAPTSFPKISPPSSPTPPVSVSPKGVSKASPVVSGSPSPKISPSATFSLLKGDADLNGKLTAADVDLAIKISLNLIKPTSTQLLVLDLDGDGKVTTKDSEKLIRLQAGVGDKPLVVAKNTLGDVNGDGRLDASDVDLLLAIASGRVSPAPIQKQVGDLNSDGKITVADAQLLFASMSFLISKQQTGAVLAGDINGDGLVNADDFELLKKVINKIIQPSSVQIAAADLNKDGTLSQEDLEAFRREFLIGGITPGASPSATPSAYVYVRLGSSHPDIKIIKSVLNREGLYNGPIDELFDRDLQDALLKFQKKYNLPATGKLNFATVKKLNELNSISGVLPKIENKIPSLLERIRNLFNLIITRLNGR